MKKIVLILVLSLLVTQVFSGDVEDFNEASLKWINSHPDALEVFSEIESLYEYLLDILGNYTCANELYQQKEVEIEKAANQWVADKSKLNLIVWNLLKVFFPSFLANFEKCTNPDKFRADEKSFDDAYSQVIKQNPFIGKTIDDFGDEIGFLTKGQIPSNQTCVSILANFIEYSRLSCIAQYKRNTSNIYAIVARFAYVKTFNLTKMAQKCLIGSGFSKFNSALNFWFMANPNQKAIYDQQDDMISSLTKILPHDEECVKKISNQLESNLGQAYSDFENGISTIRELGTKFLYVYLPESINQAKLCLKNNF